MTPEMLNVIRSFVKNCPDENCTERTVELADAAIDAEATAPDVGDANETGALAGKYQPDPDSVIINLPVEGMENSGTRVTVIVTSFWDARTLDNEIEGDEGPRLGTTATRVPMELVPMVSPFSLRVAPLTADENA